MVTAYGPPQIKVTMNLARCRSSEDSMTINDGLKQVSFEWLHHKLK